MNETKLTPLGKLVALVLAICVGAVAGAAGAAATRPHALEWRCVTVGPGDTLWGLAKESSEADPREAVHRIVKHNALGGDTLITPGMAIWVPTERDGDLREVDRAACAVG